MEAAAKLAAYYNTCSGKVALTLFLVEQEAKQLEEARLKLAKEQKKKQEMEAAAKLAAQRKAAEQAARQLAEAELQQKKAERQQRVVQIPLF